MPNKTKSYHKNIQATLAQPGFTLCHAATVFYVEAKASCQNCIMLRQTLLEHIYVSQIFWFKIESSA